jgi:hypothetical protein
VTSAQRDKAGLSVLLLRTVSFDIESIPDFDSAMLKNRFLSPYSTSPAPLEALARRIG